MRQRIPSIPPPRSHSPRPDAPGRVPAVGQQPERWGRPPHRARAALAPRILAIGSTRIARNPSSSRCCHLPDRSPAVSAPPARTSLPARSTGPPRALGDRGSPEIPPGHGPNRAPRRIHPATCGERATQHQTSSPAKSRGAARRAHQMSTLPLPISEIKTPHRPEDRESIRDLRTYAVWSVVLTKQRGLSKFACLSLPCRGVGLTVTLSRGQGHGTRLALAVAADCSA